MTNALSKIILDLRAPEHRRPINPNAVYRTRDTQLFEDAALALEAEHAKVERLGTALQEIAAGSLKGHWTKARINVIASTALFWLTYEADDGVSFGETEEG